MAAYQEDMERHEADMAAWSKATEAARTAATQQEGTATAEQMCAMRLQPSETSLLHPLRHCGL